MNLGTMEQRTEGMKKQAQELIEQAYQRGYKAGYAECEEELAKEAIAEGKQEKWIEQGRNEAWEVAKKIMLAPVEGGMPASELHEIFDCTNILQRFSASDAIERIRVYEEKKREEDEKIEVGDEVINASGDKGVVLGISNNDVFLFIPGWNVPQVTNRICCTKTGRAFPEIPEFLKKTQEGE